MVGPGRRGGESQEERGEVDEGKTVIFIISNNSEMFWGGESS